MKKSLTLLAVMAASLGATGGAQAHVVLAEPDAQAGSYYPGFFRVGHGCKGAPTVKVRIEVPEGILSAKPQPKAGWRISINREKLAEPVQGKYGLITERVASVTWEGGPLADDMFDQFGLMLKLPDEAGTLYFPTVQSCPNGGENAWVNIPEKGTPWHDTKDPAPMLHLHPAAHRGH